MTHTLLHDGVRRLIEALRQMSLMFHTGPGHYKEVGIP